MLSLAVRFIAGRYHATPWERHVNEGSVAWPPEPLRLMRALIATWHHKIKHLGSHHESTLHGLIESLAGQLPEYRLPAASHSHTRHYMPQKEVGKTSLVFDAFAAVARDEPLFVTWPQLSLPVEQSALLDDLLAVLGYLGRAESWVDAERVSEPLGPNCVPGEQAWNRQTGEQQGEVVTLLAPLPVADYKALRARFLPDKRAARDLGPTLPESLLEALSIETAALRKQGWNQHPATRKVSYLRPRDCLRPKRVARVFEPPRFTTVRYLLVGKPLPRAEDTLRIGELLRAAVMSKAGQCLGEDQIPQLLSGHDLPKGNWHQHAFYLPFDANGDGRIDRLIVHVPAGMGLVERQILERLSRIWLAGGGGEWRLALEVIGSAKDGGQLMNRAMVWQSVTPYLHPWHVKKTLGIEEQIRRECRQRHLPQPTAIERLEFIRIGREARPRRPIHFRRFRSKHGLHQPDRRGSFWKLTFPEPVQGPLALGFGCHFGLGLFAPELGRTRERPQGWET